MKELYTIVLKSNMTTELAKFDDKRQAQIVLDVLNMNQENCIILEEKMELSAEDYLKKYAEDVSPILLDPQPFDMIKTLEDRLEYVKTQKTYPVSLLSHESGHEEDFLFTGHEIQATRKKLSDTFFTSHDAPFVQSSIVFRPSDIKKFYEAEDTWQEDVHTATRDLSEAQAKRFYADDDEYYV